MNELLMHLKYQAAKHFSPARLFTFDYRGTTFILERCFLHGCGDSYKLYKEEFASPSASFSTLQESFQWLNDNIPDQSTIPEFAYTQESS